MKSAVKMSLIAIAVLVTVYVAWRLYTKKPVFGRAKKESFMRMMKVNRPTTDSEDTKWSKANFRSAVLPDGSMV